MTDLGESIAKLVSSMEKKQKCQYEPPKPKWVANLSGSSDTLGSNLGSKPDATRESELSAHNWPSQAHHLIPHLQLADHAVADWLKKGKILYADTKYNVDHRKNGLWMPYASALREWKTGGSKKKRQLMFTVMELSGMQLHQGRHSKSNTYGVGLAPYKGRVDQYLDKIDDNALSHYMGNCNDCASKEQANKRPPRNNTVTFVDKASELLKKDIKACIIFVSRIAAEFAEAGGFDD